MSGHSPGNGLCHQCNLNQVSICSRMVKFPSVAVGGKRIQTESLHYAYVRGLSKTNIIWGICERNETGNFTTYSIYIHVKIKINSRMKKKKVLDFSSMPSPKALILDKSKYLFQSSILYFAMNFTWTYGFFIKYHHWDILIKTEYWQLHINISTLFCQRMCGRADLDHKKHC